MRATRPAPGPEFAVHRLVQEVARHAQREASPPTALAEALAWVNAAFVGDPNDVRTWPLLRPLAPQALAVAQRADEYGIAEPTARLLNELGQLFGAQARYGESEPLRRRTLAIVEPSYGPQHPTVAIDLSNLAQLFKHTNRPAEAEPLSRRQVLIFLAFTRATGHVHPHLRAALGNYGGILKDLALPEADAAGRLLSLGLEAGFVDAEWKDLLVRLFGGGGG
jgi:hypothetical protein